MAHSLGELIEKADQVAAERGKKLYSIYLKLTPKNRRIADKILDDMAEGKITYREALRRLRELRRKQAMDKHRKHQKNR